MPMPAAALELHAVARSNNALAQGEALTLCRRRWRLRLQRIGGLRHVGDSTLPGLGFSASFPCTRLPAGRNALQA